MAEPQPPHFASATAIDTEKAAMDAMLICEFRCSGCYRPIHIALHTILRKYEQQVMASNLFPPFALVCPKCKAVERHSANSLRRSAVAETGPDWELAEWLTCGSQNCTSPLGLFARWNAARTLEERRADVLTWRWSLLMCESGHPAQKPREVYGVLLPS